MVEDKRVHISKKKDIGRVWWAGRQGFTRVSGCKYVKGKATRWGLVEGYAYSGGGETPAMEGYGVTEG